MSKLIKFQSYDSRLENNSTPPQPAFRFTPNWYKNHNKKIDNYSGSLLFVDDNLTDRNATLKSCMPFLDAMQSGYLVTLACDVEFSKTEQGLRYGWGMPNFKPISQHLENQVPNAIIPKNSYPTVFKWDNPWLTQTPQGYSSLFVHPLNRYDLPFLTFTGIVDTDRYDSPVSFPFVMFNFEQDSIIIEEGTPIAQIIPIKRENWKSEKMPYDDDKVVGALWKLRKTIADSYKKQFWIKKSYK